MKTEQTNDMDAAFQDLCRELEQELAAEITNREKCCRDGNAISDELFDTQMQLKASKAENTKLRKIVERYRVWSTSENPTEMELDDLKQKYDELN